MTAGGRKCPVLNPLVPANDLISALNRLFKMIYRVLRQSQINGMPYNIGVTAARFGPALQQDFPERIQSATRAFAFNALVTYDDKSFLEEALLLSDPNFFEFFSFPLKRGKPGTVLKNANSIVLSKALAEKYFGKEDHAACDLCHGCALCCCDCLHHRRSQRFKGGDAEPVAGAQD